MISNIANIAPYTRHVNLEYTADILDQLLNSSSIDALKSLTDELRVVGQLSGNDSNPDFKDFFADLVNTCLRNQEHVVELQRQNSVLYGAVRSIADLMRGFGHLLSSDDIDKLNVVKSHLDML